VVPFAAPPPPGRPPGRAAGGSRAAVFSRVFSRGRTGSVGLVTARDAQPVGVVAAARPAAPAWRPVDPSRRRATPVDPCPPAGHGEAVARVT